MHKPCLLASLFIACTLNVDAEESPSPAAWAEKMSGPAQNASAFSDPQVFQQWNTTLVSPDNSPTAVTMPMAHGAYSPGAYVNYAQFADPALATPWMNAGMNPYFYQNNFMPMMSPGIYTQWVYQPMDPQMINPGMQAMTPQTYGNWLTIVPDPRFYYAMQAYAQLLQTANPDFFTMPSETPAK